MRVIQPWWQTGCIYQVYLRSFQDSTGDGIGDLSGLHQRLPYLADLGVAAIWLSPIHPSPNVDFGYDVADYSSIHPQLGTAAALDALIDATHAAGMKVVLDGVFNHTSEAHPWFADSRQRRGGRDDWYIWRDAPNNWQSTFGGSAWTLCPQRGQYYLHSFAPQQPDLNWRSPAVQEAILANMAHWLDRGVDGFRLDVFNCYRKSASLADNPRRLNPAGLVYGYIGQHHVHDRDQDDLLEILSAMRALTDRYFDRFLVGEPLDERLRYEESARWVGSDRLHTAFNFRLLHRPWKARAFAKAINAWIADLDGEWPTWAVGNHDVPRAATRWGDSDAHARLLPLILCGLRGTPFLYYGDEIGMREGQLTRDEVQDPPGQRFWPLYRGRDGCRTPMQWTDEPGAGFSTGPSWLPAGAGRSVQSQQDDPTSILGTWKRMLALRRKSRALRSGDQGKAVTAGSVLRWTRSLQGEAVAVVVNMGSRRVSHPYLGPVLLSTHGDGTEPGFLRPHEGVVVDVG